MKNSELGAGIYVIDWLDICAGTMGEYWDTDNSVPVRCKSVGYLVKKNQKFVSIVQSLAEDSGTGGVISIPTATIIKMKRLASV